MREIDALFRPLARPQHGDIGVGRRFEEGQSATDDEERKEEETEIHQLSAGDKEEGADTVEEQSGEHPCPIAPPLDERTGRKCHQEVAAVDHGLHQRRLRFGESHRVLEILIEYVQNTVGKAP